MLQGIPGSCQCQTFGFAQFIEALRKLLSEPAFAGIDDLCIGDVKSKEAAFVFDFFRVSQQYDIDNLSAQQYLGCPEDALIAAFGQDDLASVGSGTLEESVLEHHRRHDVGRAFVEAFSDGLFVDCRIENTFGQSDFSLALRAHHSLDFIECDGSLIAVALYGQYRDDTVIHILEQLHNIFTRLQAAAENDPGNIGVVFAVKGEHRRKDNIDTVPRHDNKAAVGYPLEIVFYTHGGDLLFFDEVIQLLILSHQDLRIQRIPHFPYDRGIELFDLGKDEDLLLLLFILLLEVLFDLIDNFRTAAIDEGCQMDAPLIFDSFGSDVDLVEYTLDIFSLGIEYRHESCFDILGNLQIEIEVKCR